MVVFQILLKHPGGGFINQQHVFFTGLLLPHPDNITWTKVLHIPYFELKQIPYTQPVIDTYCEKQKISGLIPEKLLDGFDVLQGPDGLDLGGRSFLRTVLHKSLLLGG